MHTCICATNSDAGNSAASSSHVFPLQAQAHYPLVDVFAMSTYLDALAEECQQRVAATGACSSLEKLAILNQLIFNPPADGRSVCLCVFGPGQMS